MRELFHNTTVQESIRPVAYSADTRGVPVDTAGYDSLTFIVTVGANSGNAFDSTNKVTFSVEEGEVSSGTDITDTPTEIATNDYLGAKQATGVTWDRVLDASTDKEQVYSIGVRLNEVRYKQIVATEGGTVTTAIIGVVALLGHPRHAPAL